MRFFFLLVATTIAGAAIGLSTALMAVDEGIGFEAVRVGSWSAWPRAGEKTADPYTRASIARSGELPLSGAAGAAFTATTDDSGQSLLGRCDYRIAGTMPSAQWWTITVYDDTRTTIPFNAVQRYGYNSGEIIYGAAGRFTLFVSQRAHAGNWLPVGEANRLRFIVRLYDTPVATGKSFRDFKMPSITREGCRE